MPGAPAGSLGTMVGLSGARTLAGQKRPILHADDVGGANRMEHVQQEIGAGRMSADEAWQKHGVGMIDGRTPDFQPGSVPFTTVATAGEGMRLPAGVSEYKGPLGSVFDDEVLRRLVPGSKN